jgi:uncharacterized heparinase superfamily protein
MESLPRGVRHGTARAVAPLGAPPPSTRRTAREQLSLAVLTVEHVGRGALARMRRSRLLRWRYRSPAAEELLLAPPDLRAHDASFLDEVASGSFGLAGSVANLDGRSPFAVAPPSPRWARELQGFGWLRHLDAVQSAEARSMARRLAEEWLRYGHRRPHAWEPEVVSRRIVSWLAYAGLLLDGADHRRYAALMRGLADQVTYLSASWRNAPDGHPRLLALIGLVCADLCICDHDPQLARSQKLLADELGRQVPAEGGHLSRNPAILVELLLDLLPLRQCFAACGKIADPQLPATIGRITAMLRHLRLGDGALARFNGMGSTERDALATVLAYDEGRAETAVRGGYARLERGPTVVIVDTGAAPPVELAGNACAGCLSFELGTGGELLLVNAGTPAHAEAGKRALARATASHNTLSLGEQSSAKLMRNVRLERAIGSPPLAHPDRVACELRQTDEGGIELEASHDGYVERFGLIHTRTLKLDAEGTRLEGCDRLSGTKGIQRFAWDIPLAVQFHLHPEAQARVGASAESAELLLDSGEHWRLTATGAALSIEESVHFAHPVGVRRAAQVVLRAQCCGATEVSWTLERIKAGRPADAKARRKERQANKRLTERLAETGAGFDRR